MVNYSLLEGDVFDDTGISEELLNEDVLNDDELDEEAYLSPTTIQEEDAILKSPQGSTSSKSPEVPVGTAAPAQQKKVVLKRKLVQSLSTSDDPSTSQIPDASKSIKIDESSKESTNKTEANGSSVGDGHVIKLTQLTMKERLELRAKKFGASPSTDALKLARAERFGLTTNTATATQTNQNVNATNSSPAPTTVNNAPPSVDVLKKRAERFGGSVSNLMVKIENKEKLLKRQERFGATAPATATSTSSPKDISDYAEKAKLRLERFKTSA